MKSRHFVFVAIIASLALAGCVSSGNENLRSETEQSVQGKIVIGQTTKAQIRALFGSPLSTSFTDGGLEIWNYEFINVSADAVSYIPVVNLFGASASGKKKSLVIMFDRSDVVQRFSMSESPVEQRTGLFNR
jgi:outer membrane protein assembly factor BamE (lipoprotein component of BamABCDE complex)